MRMRDIVERAQRQQDADAHRRVLRLIRAIRKVDHRFHGAELAALEAVVERAYGRVMLDGGK